MPGASTRLTETATPGRRRRRRWDDEAIALVVSVCVAFAVGLFMMATEPARIDRLSVTNPSEYQIRLRVGSSALGDVEAETSRQYPNVFDQGDRWVLTFASQSVEAGTIEIDRSVLANNNWTVVIPDDIIETLRAAPIEPPPPVQDTAG
jgi:hypothetical protein